MPPKKRKSIAANKKKSIGFFGRYKKVTTIDSKIFDTPEKIRKSLFDHKMGWFKKKNTLLYHQRVFILIKNASPVLPPELRKYLPFDLDFIDEADGIDSGPQAKLFLQIRAILKKMISRLEMNSPTMDNFCGVYFFMGGYSFLIIETIEELFVEFLKIMKVYLGNFWDNNKVFWISNNIEKYYFKDFFYLTCPTVYLNEKFPAMAEDDFEFMSEVHKTIKKKLFGICECFTQDEEEDDEEDDDESESDNEQGEGEVDLHESEEEEQSDDESSSKLELKECRNPYSEEFKKLIPEAQCIDLILSCKRFYPTANYLFVLHTYTPMQLEDDELCWPMLNNYTPAHIFVKSIYDFNIAFPESNKVVNEKGVAHLLPKSIIGGPKKKDLGEEGGGDGEDEEEEEDEDAPTEQV